MVRNRPRPALDSSGRRDAVRRTNPGDQTTMREEKSLESSPESTTPTALVVDEDHDTRAVLRHVLELEGWRVVEAAEGREALSQDSRAHPDAIITSLRVPGMRGEELVARIRSRRGDIPALAITGRSSAEAVSAHFDQVLRKPISVAALRDWLSVC